MTPDPHPPVVTLNHPQTPDGRLVYDPGCFWCRDKTAQPPPTGMPKVATP